MTFSSGTSALHAVLMAAGIGVGDEVVVPSCPCRIREIASYHGLLPFEDTVEAFGAAADG